MCKIEGNPQKYRLMKIKLIKSNIRTTKIKREYFLCFEMHQTTSYVDTYIRTRYVLPWTQIFIIPKHTLHKLQGWQCAHRLPSRRLHLWSPPYCNRLCILSFALPRERFPPGRYWPCRSLSIWVKYGQLVAV